MCGMSLVSPKSGAANEEGRVGGEDSHKGPGGGRSSGRASVPGQNDEGYAQPAPQSPHADVPVTPVPVTPPPARGTATPGRASVPVRPGEPPSPAAQGAAQVPGPPLREQGQTYGHAAPPPTGQTYRLAHPHATVPGAKGFGSGDGPGLQPGGPSSASSGQSAGSVGTGPRKSRRTLAVSVFAILILLVGLAGAVFVIKPGPVDGWLADDPTSAPSAVATPEPIPTPVLAAADTDAVAPSAAGVRSAIAPLVNAAALGSQVNVSVVDGATGEELYAKNPDDLTTPASTTKLVTAATVLAARGPAYRLATRAVAGSEPGEVILIGGGDPTLAMSGKGQFPGAARLDKLAAQVKKALGGTAPSKVVIDTSLFTGPATAKGWTPSLISPEGQVSAIQPLMTNAGRKVPVHNEFGGDPRFPDPAMAVGRAFAKQLGVRTAVTRGTAPQADPSAAPGIPVPGTELGKVESPPLVHVVDWMLEQSDNTIADVLSRQVALAAGQPASFEGSTGAMIAKLGELGLPVAEIKLSDASGLSRNNKITPSLLTDLLALAAGGQQPALSSMFGGLPVAGWSGTLRTRFATPKPNQTGQGLVRAKTGSLSGVHTISGQLVTRDGRLLVFAIMADNAGDAVAARAALDRIAARLVACGC